VVVAVAVAVAVAVVVVSGRTNSHTMRGTQQSCVWLVK
jgi:hypothetical protein